MNFLEFKDEVFKLSKDLGCEAAELFRSYEESTEIGVLEGEVDSYTVSSTGGANLRVVFEGKNGFAYTQEYTDPKSLVERAVDNAKVIESTDERPMQGPTEYADITYPKNPAGDMSEEELIKLAVEMEKTARETDERFLRVSYCVSGKGKQVVELYNTLGLSAKYETANGVNFIGTVLKQGEEVEDGYAMRFNEDFLDTKNLVKEAIDTTLNKFEASPVKSGEYKIIMKNKAATSLLSAFSPMFSAELAQKKMSLLEGKEGQVIASSCFSLVDDGLFHKNPRPFDGEGVPSSTTCVVENGVLKTLLHDLKTAKKAGVKSTSNAGRSSGGGAVSVSTSNFLVKEGEISFDDLVEKMGDGLVITSLGGLHAGVNAVSGDFSLIASGYLVENGKKTRAVKQITIAGNFLKYMKEITDIANDTHYSFGGKITASPSYLVSKIIVSGT